MKNELKSILGLGVFAALVWLGGVGSANAITIRGVVEPQFSTSGSLANVDWTADIQFDVGPECVVPLFDSVCNSVSNLVVDGTLSAFGETVPINFPLFPPTTPPTITLEVNGSGTVVGIGTSPADAIGPGDFAFLNNTAMGNGFAWVQFSLPVNLESQSSAQLFLQQCTLIAPVNTEDDPVCGPSFINAVGSDVFAAVAIRQIPEPGALWLVFAALSAGWLIRRQQQPR